MLSAIGLLAIVWTGSAASADVPDRSPTPGPVKYYIVPSVGHGPADLYQIAARTLGDGSQFMRIFKLNKGRLQPNGRRLEYPRIIEPGWVLELPRDATGPGVHFGPLPQPKPSASAAPPSRSPSRGAGSSSAAADVAIAFLALLAIGAFSVAGARLASARSRRRRQVSGPGRERRSRRVGLAKTQPPSEPPDTVPSRTAAADPADWSWLSTPAVGPDLQADHPSRPQQAVDNRGWPY